MNWSWLLVLVVYVTAVAVARRAGAELPRRVALLFAFLVFAFLWQPLTQPVVIVPADVLKLLPPWSEQRAPGRPPLTKYEVSNLNLHDVPMQIVPWMHQVRESWRAGKVPLWNAAAGCGYPLLANGQSTPFSPLVLLTLPLPLGYAVTAQAALKLLAALVFTYVFCRRRYSPLASSIAAISYGFSTWMVTWLQFPIAAAAAMLPAVLLAVEMLLRRAGQGAGSRARGAGDESDQGAVSRARGAGDESNAASGSAASDSAPAPRALLTAPSFVRRAFAAPVAIFVVTVVSGHPETVFNIGLIAAAHGLWIGSIRGLLRVAAASVMAALITSPYLLPMAEAIVHSQRFAEVRVNDDVVPPFSDRASAILLLQPRFFGHLPIERPWGPTTLESVCGFAGVLSLVCAVAAAIFIVRRRRWRDRETFYLLGLITCFGIVLGWPVISQAFDAVAGLAPPMRMRLGICWFASVLVAAVVDWTRREGAKPLLAAAVAVSTTMLVLMRTTEFPTASHSSSALLSLLPGMAVLASLTLVVFRRREAFVIAGALTVVELWVTMAHWNPILPARELQPRTALVAQLESLRGLHRIVGLGGQMYPNTGAYWRLDDVRVHDPMAPARYVDYLGKNVGWNAADYYAKWSDPSSPLLDRLNVRYVVNEDGTVAHNADARARFYSDDAAVTIVGASDDAYRLRVRAARHALVASSVTNYPGWSAGSFRVFEHDGPFVAFMVPPGNHEVTVRYRPRSFYAPIIPAMLATAFVLWRMRRDRRLR